MAGLFSRLFGGGDKNEGAKTSLFGGGSGDSEKTKRIKTYYRPFEDLDAGLPASIARYIVGGDASSVLSTLSTQNAKSTWSNRYSSKKYNYEEQNGFFRKGLAWTAVELARLGDVMEAIEPVSAGNNYGLGGSGISPPWLRRVLSHYGETTSKIRTVPLLLEMIRERGLGLDVALDMVFSTNQYGYNIPVSADAYEGTQDWMTIASDNIIAAASKLKPAQRGQIATAAGRYGLSDTYLDLIIDVGLTPGKGAKAAAKGAVAAATPDTLRDNLDARYKAAKPGGRVDLIALALAGLGTKAPPLLESWRSDDESANVKTALDQALGTLALVSEATLASTSKKGNDGSDGYLALDGSMVTFPPRPEIPRRSAIPQSVFTLLEPTIKSYNDFYEKEKRAEKGNHWGWTKHANRIDPLTFQAMKSELEGEKRNEGKKGGSPWSNLYMAPDQSGVDAFLAHEDVSVRHLLALVQFTSGWNLIGLYNHPYYQLLKAHHVKRITQNHDIRVVAAIWEEQKGSNGIIEHLQRNWYYALNLPDPEVAAPLIPAHFNLIDEAFSLRPQSGQIPVNLQAAIELLSILPKVPQRYLLPLMTLASGGTKTQRADARHLLKEATGIEDNIAGLLKDGKQDVRAGAADWLAQRGAKDQIGAIRAALKTEKSDVARAALINALERLGDDVNDLFDQKVMKKEAEAGLAKTALKGLDWFPFDLMPRVSWKDGSQVDPVLTRWWIVLSAKLKTPGGNALMDLWLDRLAEGDAHKLGWFVLSAWTDQDSRQTAPEEANAYANAHVDRILVYNQDMVKKSPQYAEYYVTDRDKIFASLRNEKLNTYLGSATESKGILALTTKVNGVDASKCVRAYLKNHGSRMSQCKALLDCLASNGSSAAIQVLLATSNRFKARTVQAHATTLIEDLAERRGWTHDELADRTIPTGGLDETGQLDLDCGPYRTYKIVLDETDTIVLLNPDGKKVSTLPGPRVDEEKPLIEEAKKLLTTARKEVKQILPDQIARLREAMLLERTWPREDWLLYVRGHVLVGRIAQRLVWMALDEDGKLIKLFRPLDDGSLTDVEDGDFDLSVATCVQPAHSSLIDRTARDAWRAHIEAYEIKAPFDQFGSAAHVLDSEQKSETEIKDRKGWMIETFALRGIATKLGYVRGAAEDGGWFTRYEKRYQSAGIIVSIDFSGSPLPEENKLGVLYGATFTKLRKGSDQYGNPMSLEDVPPVLLTQSWQDLHDIADKGTGYNPEWEKHNAW
jgi:Domain of unknown function (DUF4132)